MIIVLTLYRGLRNCYPKLKYFTYIKQSDIPSIRLRIPFRYGRNEMDIFDSNGERKTMFDITKNTFCKFIIAPLEIWISDKYYGILWTIKATIIINSDGFV